MPVFWICQSSEYARVTYGSEYPRMCLNDHEHRNMPEYYRINRFPKINEIDKGKSIIHWQ